MPLRWWCSGCGKKIAPGVQQCDSCEPALTEEPELWTSPARSLAGRLTSSGIRTRPGSAEVRGAFAFHDPSDAEDLAEGAPYIWDDPQYEFEEE